MPLLFLAIDAILVTSLWHSHRLYLKTFRWEKRQIAVDNAAITLGQKDRALLRWLQENNRKLTLLDIDHDLQHDCARTSPDPAVRASCRLRDIALEAELHLKRTQLLAEANARWSMNSEISHAKYNSTLQYYRDLDSDFQRKDVAQLIISNRPEHLPAVSKKCSFCLLDVQWELRPSERLIFKLKSHRTVEDVDANLDGLGSVFSTSPPASPYGELNKPIEVYVQLLGESLVGEGAWDYRLTIDEGGAYGT